MSEEDRPIEASLRDRVRLNLANGTLFPLDDRVWARQPSGHECIVCGNPIRANEVEYEIPRPDGNVYTHIPCWTIWREESVDRREEPERGEPLDGGSSPSGGCPGGSARRDYPPATSDGRRPTPWP